MKTLHSFWGALVLLMLIATVINAIVELKKKGNFADKDLRLGLFTLIVTHMQFLIGIVLYVIGKWYKGFDQMKNAGIRLLILEHPLMMIIIAALITIGWSKHKKQKSSAKKFKTFLIFYGAALLLVLIRIPWKNWINTWL